MLGFLDDLFLALRAAREVRRRRTHGDWIDQRAAALQAARLAVMTDDELICCASQWSSAMCRREMRRRGISPDHIYMEV